MWCHIVCGMLWNNYQLSNLAGAKIFRNNRILNVLDILVFSMRGETGSQILMIWLVEMYATLWWAAHSYELSEVKCQRVRAKRKQAISLLHVRDRNRYFQSTHKVVKTSMTGYKFTPDESRRSTGARTCQNKIPYYYAMLGGSLRMIYINGGDCIQQSIQVLFRS